MATIDAFDPPEVRRREQRGWYFYDGAASAFSGRIGLLRAHCVLRAHCFTRRRIWHGERLCDDTSRPARAAW